MLKILLCAMLLPGWAWAQRISQLAYSAYDHEIIDRKYYSLSYNEDHEVANWVAYSLSASQMKNCVGRFSSFRADPLISTGSASLVDYKNSGFDRGHLLPAGDMKFDQQAMRDTFYLSNVTPQTPDFNRGKWSHLELLMRAWAQKYGKVWIVTGPILKKNLPTIGPSRVSVPHYHYKVLLRKEGKAYKGIGFVMAQNVPYVRLETYALSIRKIEAMTGIDFFHFMPPAEADQIENTVNHLDWDFKAEFNYLPCSA